MILGKTKRPRNVDSPRAAAILYGDWGTSKAYVIGLAFAIAGYSSFWLIVAMSVLLALVGINYMAICRHYPDGGGVYASVYHRSKNHRYRRRFPPHCGLHRDRIDQCSIRVPVRWSAASGNLCGVAILGIGALNFFGPKRTGELAIAEPRFELPEGTTYGSPMLCAVRGIGGTLEFAIGIAKDMNRPLYITFVREQAILTLEDRKRHWTDDPQARKIFAYAKEKADGHPILPRYTVSDVPAHTIVDLAVTVGASRLILGAPRKNMLVKLIRGNMILQVSRFLPEKIHLLVYA
jgi:hypothetical protein